MIQEPLAFLEKVPWKYALTTYQADNIMVHLKHNIWVVDDSPEVRRTIEAILPRIVKGINNTNGNVDILYDYNPTAFNTYRSKWGFKKLLNRLLEMKKES